MNNIKIKSYIDKRNDHLILNNYELLDIYDDINLIIHFLNKNKIKIIIRKFNPDINNNQFKLKIYDIDDENYEILFLGSLIKNWKIVNFKTKINICKKDNIDLQIPKKIFQTYNNNDYHNVFHYNAVQSILEFNPDFEYYFYNDIDCRDFIKNNYDQDTLNCYDILYPCAYKADLFRYLLIYKYGGIYIDNKYIIRNSFYSIIDKDDTNLYCSDKIDNCLLNSVLITKANELNYKLLIEKIILNIKNNIYGICPLHPTGPRIFYEFFNKCRVKLYHKVYKPVTNYKNCIIHTENFIFLNTFYHGYYHNKNHRNKIKNDYDFCFRNKLIYLNDFYEIKNYKFSILYDKKIEYKVILHNEHKNLIFVKLFIKNLNIIQKIRKKHKFIFINNKNNKIQEFDLLGSINKIIEIEI